MHKLIASDSYDHGMAALSEMHVSTRGADRGYMSKRAAVLDREIAALRPEPGRSLLHLIAMGATESFGANRNADGFKRAELQRTHHTFVDNGHVFENHRNTDPVKAQGTIKHSAYNDDMDRVELVISVKNDKWENELHKLASGKDVTVSMACKVAYDVCEICGNKAPNRSKYCGGMRKFAGQILDDGRKVYVDNPNPLFFDLSKVFRPADPTAYTLRKVASASQAVVTGALLAEEAGLVDLSGSRLVKSANATRKLRLLHKLASLEKEIEGCISAPTNTVLELSKSFTRPVYGADDAMVSELQAAAGGDRFNALLRSLSDMRVSLPLRTLLDIVAGKSVGHESRVAEPFLPGLFSHMLETGPEEDVNDTVYDPAPVCVGGDAFGPGRGLGMARGLMERLSLDETPVKRRMLIVVSGGNSSEPELQLPSQIHTIKASAASARELAREYGRYKLAFLAAATEEDDDELLLRLTVLQNYIR